MRIIYIRDRSFTAEYDDIADVLYVVIGNSHHARMTEDEAGLVLQFDEKTNAPVGATIIDFKEYWLARHRTHLVDRLTKFLHLPRKDIESFVETFPS